MPILVSEAVQSAIRRLLPAAGLVAVVGFQGWLIAKYGFDIAALLWGAAAAAGLGAGFFIILRVRPPFPRAGAAFHPRPHAVEQADRLSNSRAGSRNGNDAGRRLAEAEASLGRLEAERRRRNDPGYGKVTEDKIIWRELLELELQAIDEQASRIRTPADTAGGGPARASMDTNASFHTGGRHGRNHS